MKHHLTRIRQSDQKTKRRWLIGLTGGTIIIIIAIWILYMRAFVFVSTDPLAQEDVRIGFWPVFKNGLTITGSSIRHTFDTILSEMPELGRKTTTIQNPK